MVDYLTHYYKRGASPFQTLSALSEADALKIMEGLRDDSPLFARFKEPIHYLNGRRQTEAWLREQFVAKGGQPIENFPLYAVLGSSEWIEKHSFTYGIEKIIIPISNLNEAEITFTFTDSMVSHWLGRDKPSEYYQPDYHGKVFTFSEATTLLNSNGLPEEKWKTTLPPDVAPYIEAQLWNHKLLVD